MINIPKGTKDVLPSEIYKWHYIERMARETAELYGVKETRTPMFEHTELFNRGVGDTTDVVNKEMYTFLDKAQRSITLRPEGTAGVARMFIENGLSSTPLPVKMYYLISAFRYERPQAGRLREFHQFGIEIFGSPTPDMDAEVILIADTFLKKLGIKEVKLFINSIGCKECRTKYNEVLKDYLRPNLDCLCETCKSRFDKNPLRMLDCKEEGCRKFMADAPRITDYLCQECSDHFEKLKSLLTASGVEYEVDPGIVRGLDYYSRTVFEFVSTAIGSQGTVCGGGRYDTLIENLGGPSVPAIGFAAGIERLILLMENTGISFGEEPAVKIYIAGMDDKSRMKAFEIAQNLRKEGIPCETDHMSRSIKAQFKYAGKLNCKYVAVIGESEMQNEELNLKDMTTGEQKSVKWDKIKDYLTGENNG